MNNLRCRYCNNILKYTFVDLGMSPLANSYLEEKDLKKIESFYPLKAYVCEKCFLVQLPEIQSAEHIFSDYAYLSSYSDSWLRHAQDYVEMVVDRFGFNTESQIIEIASNDGYLLQFFKEKEIPILGIEPAQNVAQVAQAANIPTLIKFFNLQTAMELIDKGVRADLLIGNNVLAHVPKLNDFIDGMKTNLRPHGIITMEFPHLMKLMKENQFDTIYHEHFSYFSFITVQKIFLKHGLTLFDVEEISTHGGSLRIYAKHTSNTIHSITNRVDKLLDIEREAGFDKLETYLSFSQKVQETKLKVLEFLIQAKRADKSVVGYGAPAKANTLLNFCGIRSDFIDFTVDRSPYKQNHYLPGTHIPICHPDKIKESKPDYLLILPWNLKQEIMEQMAYTREWGCQFVTLIPEVEVCS